MEQKIVVSGILFHEGRVLVIRRSQIEKNYPGKYELPGGKVDFGEDTETALKREYFEETGLKIDVNTPYRVFSYMSNNNERHCIEIVYTVFLRGEKKITLSPEHDDYQWILPETINSINCTDEIKENIRQGINPALQKKR